MNDADIENAIKARIAGGGLIWPIAWPNQNAPGTVPFIALDIVPTARTDVTLDSSVPIVEGFVMARAIVQEGTSTAAANSKADQIADLFPRGLKIVIAGGGTILVIKHPEPLQGFAADQKWIKPVRITFLVS